MNISVYDVDRFGVCLNEDERTLWEARPSYINAAIMKAQAKHVEQTIFQIDIPAEESSMGEVVKFMFSSVENK